MTAVQANVMANLSDQALACLPANTTIARVLRRAKNNPDEAFPLPARGNINFSIPPHYQDFLLHDTGINDPNRILVFGSASQSRALSRAETLVCDGTFKVVPEVFFQLYSVHAQLCEGTCPAVLYCLLPNKSAATYSKMVEIITNRLMVDNRVTNVLLDFESAAIAAFRAGFPNARVTACFFHLSQSVLRKIQSLGLRELYSSEETFHMWVKCFPSLSHVPIADVESAFLELCDRVPEFPAHLDKIDEFLEYFETTYVRGRPRLNGARRAATFPPSLWNQRDNVADGVARTVNACEGWHYSLQALFLCHHPNIWKFLNGLKGDCAKQRATIQQFVGGAPMPPPRRVFRELKARTARTCERYNPAEVVSFLQAVATLAGL